jgi:thiol-disulfide isomerase/thioredoxin
MQCLTCLLTDFAKSDIPDAALFAIGRPPPYDGPRDYEEPMTPPLFEESVLRSSKGSWIIFFSARWSPHSVAVAPMFGQLSQEFSNCGLQFGEVELDSWPSVADQVKV